MTTTFSNQEQENLSQLIFNSIDEIGKKMEETPDLSLDVLPFMNPSFAKIKQLALLKQSDNVDYYELIQIATNYIPKVVHTYCSFPLEYRNKTIIKNNLTARQILIEDLKILRKQIDAVEKNMYSSFETQMKINSTLMKEKYNTSFQLQSDVDSSFNDNFINQFDITQYTENLDYKKIHFTKDETQIAAEKLKQEKLKAKKAAQEQMIRKISSIVKASSSRIFQSTSNFSHKFLRASGNILETIWDTFGFGIIVISVFLFFIGGFISLINFGERDSRLFRNSLSSVQKIHGVMSTSKIPTLELPKFIEKIKEETIDGSYYRENNLSFNPLENNQGLVMHIKEFSKIRCSHFIDWKEVSFDYVDLKVNGITLPQDNLFSNYNAFKNENHNLCHLDNGNEITVTFNNNSILAKSLADKSSSPEHKQIKLTKYKEEIKNLNGMIEKADKTTYKYTYLNNMKKELEDSVKKMETKD